MQYLEIIFTWLMANFGATDTAAWKVSSVTAKTGARKVKRAGATVMMPYWYLTGIGSAKLEFKPIDGEPEPESGKIYALVCARIGTESARGDNPQSCNLPARLHTSKGDIRGYLVLSYPRLAASINGATGTRGAKSITAIDAASFDAAF